ncbi:MAG: hypothetical protein CM15mP36_12310 [Flavobacteriales bacterium]|nr:MAG: hypothetical protein CM15mP36_12310 [Flavobacteriales bacterium]
MFLCPLWNTFNDFIIPDVKVLFNQTEQLNQPPVWEGISEIANFVENYLNYFVTTKKLQVVMMC